MSRRSWYSFVCLGVVSCLAGCDQLGNPQQHATGPTAWDDQYGHLVTTTRSFQNEKTIRRLVSEELDDLDYADPSIGPSETLTLVFVVPRRIRVRHGPTLTLVTILKLPDRPPIFRRWTVPASSRHWSAAFALPGPPVSAVTSVAP
ncbi:MAG: hypothetical protein AMJ62_08800 [Myxococcales bacterium SG8_38]|nr:MAG: hypothetical protein AMJ62_08800 [Myxococcales bacterium SG8_38]